MLRAHRNCRSPQHALSNPFADSDPYGWLPDPQRSRPPPGPALETSRCVLTGCRARAQSRGIGLFYWSTFTARATTRAVVDSAMIDWNDIRALAHLLSGMVSVGENANTLVRLT